MTNRLEILVKSWRQEIDFLAETVAPNTQSGDLYQQQTFGQRIALAKCANTLEGLLEEKGNTVYFFHYKCTVLVDLRADGHNAALAVTLPEKPLDYQRVLHVYGPFQTDYPINTEEHYNMLIEQYIKPSARKTALVHYNIPEKALDQAVIIVDSLTCVGQRFGTLDGE